MEAEGGESAKQATSKPQTMVQPIVPAPPQPATGGPPSQQPAAGGAQLQQPQQMQIQQTLGSPSVPQIAANPQQLMAMMASNPAAFAPLFPNAMGMAALNSAGAAFLPPSAISFPTGQVTQNSQMVVDTQNPLMASVFQQQQAAGGTVSAPGAPQAAVGSTVGMKVADPPQAPVYQAAATGDPKRKGQMTSEERAKHNRDRNREHARSTRLRKKAYVQKLKELVEGLHAERTEEVRQRRVAIQHLSEVQTVRRKVVRSFLQLHSNFTADERKWSTVLEDDFWLKQPVTPYRSFRRAEIEKECRMSRGLDAAINDSASLSVMIECIGSKSSRWIQIKREEFLFLEQSKRSQNKATPRCIIRQDSRLNHAVSSLSSSSESVSGADGIKKGLTPHTEQLAAAASKASEAKKVSSSSGSGSDSAKQATNVQLHDYNAAPLPDPKLTDETEDSSPVEGAATCKRPAGSATTDSSDDTLSEERQQQHHVHKRRKTDQDSNAASELASTNSSLPPNIAKKGGIAHNIQPIDPPNGAARLRETNQITLPPFAGIGKTKSEASITRSLPPAAATAPAPVYIADVETSSNEDGASSPQIACSYHINEDDMILMDDVLMTPFVFRSQDAVTCGAFCECVMPGMLRASFSARNKLTSVELVYDAMGFFQQLSRASGNESMAQIVAGSLEMALAPSDAEARVITVAKPPYQIVNVNEVWTRMTGYTQVEVEGKDYLQLTEGEGTVPDAKVRSGKPAHHLEEVSRGRPACSTNILYDGEDRDFVQFVCSYPLTNSNDEITHILHVWKELPSFKDTMGIKSEHTGTELNPLSTETHS